MPTVRKPSGWYVVTCAPGYERRVGYSISQGAIASGLQDIVGTVVT